MTVALRVSPAFTASGPSIGKKAWERLMAWADKGELVIQTFSASSHSNQPARPCRMPSRAMVSSTVHEKKSGVSACRSMQASSAGPGQHFIGLQVDGVFGVDAMLAQPVKFARDAGRLPAFGELTAFVGLHRAQLQPQPAGNQAATGLEKAAAGIGHDFDQAIVEAEVADMVANDDVHRLRAIPPGRTCRG